jgi:hypothetical protein
LVEAAGHQAEGRDEFLYLNIEYTLAAPSEYAQTFFRSRATTSSRRWATQARLEGSGRLIAPPGGHELSRFTGLRAAPRTMASRRSTRTVLKGDMITGFVAMGAGTPLPLDFVRHVPDVPRRISVSAVKSAE